MRIHTVRKLALALILIGTGFCLAQTALADDAPATGSWKLVLLPFGEDEFAIINLTEKEGKATGSVTSAQQILRGPQLTSVEQKDGNLLFTLKGAGISTSFKGKRVKDGANAGKFLGMASLGGAKYPARLKPTKDTKVGPLKQGPMIAKVAEISKEKDPKNRIKLLEESIRDNHGNPSSSFLYADLLRTAEAANTDSDKLKDVVKRWLDEARPYGDEWLNDIRLRALRAVAASKSRAKLAVELAQDAERDVSESDIDLRATILGFLARAAKESGMETLAKETEARHAKLEQQLDLEYYKKVPPFKPTEYTGRKDKTADQTVLMELFTGAQCPPCVAPDVAFDALLTTYKPTEFIGLQYHLHIPGPDPLTNNDSEARQKYYGSQIRGTPSTFFNGQSDGSSGGFMPQSESKYDDYRKIIDKSLETAKGANIAITATRAGDKIKIEATAELTKKSAEESGSGKSGAGSEPNSKERSKERKPVLRFALTEEAIHYVGSNKLRFHHHVVRALPGGAKGIELKDGKGKAEVTISLAELKDSLEKYLSDFTKRATFPNALPEIKLDKLAIVAFVQDDENKRVLHAVSVPVTTVNP